ncbi:hypothetical protein L6452_01624 [Arctium lappa]|uniref:Uncharacterized protein n=1 Tax=Arctium lappa TaxID=4217 RepID=A0ACB9FH77_ARCLA|nr:hypothetical protein L6452_01624 [Arctium lappa]
MSLRNHLQQDSPRITTVAEWDPFSSKSKEVGLQSSLKNITTVSSPEVVLGVKNSALRQPINLFVGNLSGGLLDFLKSGHDEPVSLHKDIFKALTAFADVVSNVTGPISASLSSVASQLSEQKTSHNDVLVFVVALKATSIARDGELAKLKT